MEADYPRIFVAIAGKSCEFIDSLGLETTVVNHRNG